MTELVRMTMTQRDVSFVNLLCYMTRANTAYQFYPLNDSLVVLAAMPVPGTWKLAVSVPSHNVRGWNPNPVIFRGEVIAYSFDDRCFTVVNKY